MRTADLENQENKLPMFFQKEQQDPARLDECVSKERGSCIKQPDFAPSTLASEELGFVVPVCFVFHLLPTPHGILAVRP